MIPVKKVLVCGSREWPDTLDGRRFIADRIAMERPADGRRLVIVQGGAAGADRIAGNLSQMAFNCTPVEVTAMWAHDGRGPAGPIRNGIMLTLGIDVVLAFYKSGAGNRGTANMVKQAKEAGVPVKEYWSEDGGF